MNRDTFLHTLSQALSSLSATERDEIVQDYASYFADALADGQCETDVATKLGDPLKLARELIAQRRLGAWESRRSPKNLWALFAATAGLGVMNLVLAVPILCYFAVLTVLSVLGVGLALVGLVLVLVATSQGLLGWPTANQFVLNTSGIGPVIIDSSGGSQTPQIHIQGDAANESFRLDHGPDGGVAIQATEGNKTFALKKNADGSINKLDIRDGDRQVELSHLRHSGPWTRGLVGLVFLALGGLLLWLCRSGFGKLLTWLRNYLSQQLQHLQSMAA
ncbi:HAAS signaling domain-containing protein [Rhodoferax sp.]|uniref:DUF1700 domain-containing protein n=1 Tax=Rhodoferax sp. TaxID=50421 RepID=UPI00284CD982|nr:DUF1700 domain-containing protein [Rhodoferax sp.]MDR3370626.1 DUF1700 domain-containing protein [Rhodoferax sp.]